MESLLVQLDQAIKTIEILDGYNEDVEFELENTLKPLVAKVKSSLAEFNSHLKKTAEINDKRIYLNTKLDEVLERMAYMKENLPSCMYESKAESSPNHIQVENDIQETKDIKTIKIKDKSPLREIENIEREQTPKPKPGLEISISYINNNEMQSVPQYMKGRLKIADVNAFVDIFNNTINKKYALLKKPKNMMKLKKDLDVWIEWKSQQKLVSEEESYFCTAKDFDTQLNVKLGKKEFSIIMILRHLKRIKETRNKKLVFYVACF